MVKCLLTFCLIFFLQLSLSQGLENITAVIGQNVTLPCKVLNNKHITAVEWNRFDLDPEYVLFYRDGHFDPINQLPSYKNRADLKDREMKDGDVSLILKNVTMNDTGRYKCHVLQEKTMKPINIIILEVLPPGYKDGGDKVGGDKVGGDKVGGDNDGISRDGGTILGIILGVVGFLLLVVTLVGFLIYKRRNMRQNVNLPVPPDEAAAELML